MKHYIIYFIVATSLILHSCKNKSHTVTAEIINNPITADNSDTSELPKIQFEKVEHDFGILMQGEKVTYTFKFKNIGKQDLIVKEATASCGCTVPKFTSEPVPPGEQGEIEVIFNSSNRSGRQVKTLTVWTNCQPNQTKLQITSEIVEPK
jgi:hypothetical protein